MPPMTPGVKQLAIVNLIVFIITLVYPISRGFLALYAPDQGFQPYQLITYMFTHGNLIHFVFNMFALITFGTPVEMRLGIKKLFWLYLVCGLGAVAVHFGLPYLLQQGGGSAAPVVGASGSVYGILLVFALLFPNTKLSLMFLPFGIEARYFIPLLMLGELFLGGQSYSNDNVAHFAHIGGAVTGLLMMLVWFRTLRF